MKPYDFPKKKNESGAALIIALIMIVVLTLVGLASTFSSTFDIKLSGNKRGATDAFFAADSGIQVTMGRIENFNMAGKFVNDRYNPLSDAENPNPTHAAVTIVHDPTQTGAPRGAGFSALNFEYQHHMVESTGQDQIELALAKSSCTIQEKVVRLVPTAQGGY
jgi:Tfp pilus assembly protein PilX